MKKNGFTLAEILFCLAALVPIMLIILGVFPFAFGLDRRAWERLDAQEIARAQIESLRSANFDSLSAPINAQETRDNNVYTTQVLIDVFPLPQSTVNQKRASVTVSWPTNHGTQSLQLQTLLFKWAQ